MLGCVASELAAVAAVGHTALQLVTSFVYTPVRVRTYVSVRDHSDVRFVRLGALIDAFIKELKAVALLLIWPAMFKCTLTTKRCTMYAATTC
jgi:hypothetical protein